MKRRASLNWLKRRVSAKITCCGYFSRPLDNRHGTSPEALGPSRHSCKSSSEKLQQVFVIIKGKRMGNYLLKAQLQIQFIGASFCASFKATCAHPKNWARLRGFACLSAPDRHRARNFSRPESTIKYNALKSRSFNHLSYMRCLPFLFINCFMIIYYISYANEIYYRHDI